MVFAICAAIVPARAHAVSLTLGPDGPGLAQDRVAVLYASRNDGSTIALARVGDLTIDGGEITEIGVPSETADGRVLFGASVEDRTGHEAWDIFIGDPDAPPAERIARAIMPLALSSGCTPRFKVDPYPIGTANGAIAFMAAREEGGDALFLYRGGHLDCLLGSGDKLHDRREVAGLSFGTAEAGGNSIALIAFLKRDKNDAAKPAVWWRDHLQAMLLVSPERGVTEIAVEGTPGPQGGTFGAFGLPSAGADESNETAIAFADERGSQTSLYIYRGRKLTRVLRSGAASTADAINFLSQGRPSLSPEGLVAVRAATGDRDILLLSSGEATRVIAKSGDMLGPDALVTNLGDPWLVDGARVYFPALAGGRDGFFTRDASGVIRELETPAIHATAFSDRDAGRHAIASGTLFANPRGSFTYLGGR